jgi:hypothetical protein
MNRKDLVPLVEEAIRAHGGTASVLQVAKYIWQHHERELRASGDLFFTWQYDMRWAAQKLRGMKRLAELNNSKRGIWQIVGTSS